MTLKSNEIDLIEAVPPRFFNLKYICLGGGILKGTVFYYLPNLATVPENIENILVGDSHGWEISKPHEFGSISNNLGPWWNQPFAPCFGWGWGSRIWKTTWKQNISLERMEGVCMKKPLWWYQLEHVLSVGWSTTSKLPNLRQMLIVLLIDSVII